MRHKNVAAMTLTFILLVGMALCTGSDDDGDHRAVVEDAYCDNDGHFHFTIVSRTDETLDVDYSWSLNDPSADEPVLEGSGNAALLPESREDVGITFEESMYASAWHYENMGDYDARFFVMYVELGSNGDLISEYREQKSTHDWDYSVLPPIKYMEKRDHLGVAFETFIDQNREGDYTIIIDNISYNPPGNPVRMLLEEVDLYLDDERFRVRNIISPGNDPSAVVFYDADGNGHFSDGDKFIVKGDGEGGNGYDGAEVRIDTGTAEVYKEWMDDKLVSEDPDAIVIEEISIDPKDPSTLDHLTFQVKVKAKNELGRVRVSVNMVEGKGGSSSDLPMDEVGTEDGITTYKGTFGKFVYDDDTRSDWRMFYIVVSDDQDNERLVSYLIELK